MGHAGGAGGGVGLPDAVGRARREGEGGQLVHVSMFIEHAFTPELNHWLVLLPGLRLRGPRDHVTIMRPDLAQANPNTPPAPPLNDSEEPPFPHLPNPVLLIRKGQPKYGGIRRIG